MQTIWTLMRDAAMIRHAMLVYGVYGFGPCGDAAMRRHAGYVRAVYGW